MGNGTANSERQAILEPFLVMRAFYNPNKEAF